MILNKVKAQLLFALLLFLLIVEFYNYQFFQTPMAFTTGLMANAYHWLLVFMIMA